MSGDGVSLVNISHPRPVWWRRMLALVMPRPDIDPASLVSVTVQIPDPPEPIALINKLLVIGALEHGDPLPRWMYDESGSWAAKFSRMCNDAACALDESERQFQAKVAENGRLLEGLLYVLQDESDGTPRASSACREYIKTILADMI